MSIIGWIIFGLIAGFIASKIVNNRVRASSSTSSSASSAPLSAATWFRSSPARQWQSGFNIPEHDRGHRRSRSSFWRSITPMFGRGTTTY